MSITLAELEVEVARRCGPFAVYATDAQVPGTSLAATFYVAGLQSAIDQDAVGNLFVLRRGVLADGSPVPNLDPRDRQRQVFLFDPKSGRVEVDRPYMNLVMPTEVIEFHHLDPTQELRPAVLAGLRRTFSSDRYSLGTNYLFEVDLTSALPWLTNPRDVLSVAAAPAPTGYQSPVEMPFTAFMQAGHVCIRLGSGYAGPYYGGVYVTVARSYFSLVNGVDQPGGPTADTDVLEVDLDYGAAFGHIEAWHRFQPRLNEAGAGGLQATMQQAANEATRQAYIHNQQPPGRYGFETMFGAGPGVPLVVNA